MTVNCVFGLNISFSVSVFWFYVLLVTLLCTVGELCGFTTLHLHIFIQSACLWPVRRQVDDQSSSESKDVGRTDGESYQSFPCVCNIAPFLLLSRSRHCSKGCNSSPANMSVIRSLYIQSASALTSKYALLFPSKHMSNSMNLNGFWISGGWPENSDVHR